MHRFLLGDPPFDGAQVDHINGDGLDNRRLNLRWCSRAENRRNEPKRLISASSSKFKGVSLVSNNRNKWRAYIRHPQTQKQIFLGHWDAERDAAKAYNDACLEFYGEFARPNVL